MLTSFSFISSLEAKIAFYERNGRSYEQHLPSPSHPHPPENTSFAEPAQDQHIHSFPIEDSQPERIPRSLEIVDATSVGDVQQDDFVLPPSPTNPITSANLPGPLAPLTTRSSPEPQLMNPLALGASAYAPDAKNRMPSERLLLDSEQEDC